MKSKKKIGIIVASVVLVIILAVVAWFFLFRDSSAASSDDLVYVTKVEQLINLGSGNGLQNRFSGVVETQDSWSVQRNPEKEVKEIFVKAGDSVKKGDKLFTYDVEKMKEDIEKAELENERLENEKTSIDDGITALEKDKKNAAKEDQASLQLQINELELQLKQKEYEIKSKKAEIDKIKDNVNNATVSSEMDGIVKSVQISASEDPYGMQDDSFITIISTGSYQIKGKLNEMNNLMEGEPVIVRSRKDSEKSWKGTVSKIDYENQSSDQSQMYYGNGSDSGSSTFYPFYVSLETSDDLRLGQHVYIELDLGQDEIVEKEGLWLEEYYIDGLSEEGQEPFVWADNGNGRLEKRSVTLGEYDENLMKHEIKSGLTEEDAITFPEPGLEEGMKTEISSDMRMGQANPDLGSMEDGLGDGDMMPIEGEDGIIDGDVLPEGEGDMIGGEAIPGGDVIVGEGENGGEIIGGVDGGDEIINVDGVIGIGFTGEEQKSIWGV